MAAHKRLRDSLRSHLVNPFYSVRHVTKSALWDEARSGRTDASKAHLLFCCVLAQHLDLCKVATSLDNLQGFLAMAMPQFDCVAVIGPLEAWLTILQPICLHGNCEHIGLYNFLLAPFQESHQAPPEAAPATAQQTRAWHPTSWCATSFAVRNLKVHCFA
eukprot:scaffold140745_cov22-Tisochrysis_lutea.AAC.1